MSDPLPPDRGDPKAVLGQTISGDQLKPDGARPQVQRTQRSSAAGDELPELRGERLERRLAAVGLTWRGEAGTKRFELGGLLGSGATGRVFTVHDADLDRDIAVKVLSNDVARGPDDIAAFIDEARITAGLSHPHVVPVHEIDVTSAGSPYFTMSKVAGRTLGDAIVLSSPAALDPKIADPNRVVSAVIAVGHAVAYAHHRGIIHQDIKPDNILLGDFGEVLLLDWGSASRWPAEEARLYGTPLYMSPEQARLESSTPSSDVYCLGATLFHALTLRVPTWSDDPEEFWRRKRAGEIDPPTQAERDRARPALLAIAMTAMAARPADRYPTVEALVVDLERYQAGLAVSVFNDSPWRLLARWYRANRRVVWVSIASMLLLAALGAAFWNEKRKERSDWALVYRDDLAAGDMASFERDWQARTKGWHALGFTDQTLVGSTQWRLEGGRLVVEAGEGYYDLAFRRRLRGDIRVEWDYTPLRMDQNLNCFIDADDRLAGYTFHIGGWGSSELLVMTRGEAVERIDERFEPGLLQVGRTLHYVMEREGRHLRLSIDGRRMFDHMEYDDLQAPGGQGFGFDCCFGTMQAVANIQVWHRPLAERISPIAVGTQLFQFGHFADAAKSFDEVATSYPGSDLEPQARYRKAVSEIAAGDAKGGLTGLRGYVARFPGHADVPLALRTWERMALEGGDEEDARRADDLLMPFRGHPVLPLLFKEIASLRQRRLEGVDWLGAFAAPADATEINARTERELHAWCERHGVAYANQTFSDLAVYALSLAGETDLICELYAADPARRSAALLEQGRVSECERLYGSDHNVRTRILLQTGRFEEALAMAGNTYEREEAAVELDQPERLLATDPQDRSLQCRALIDCGRFQEVIDHYPDQRGWFASALVKAGRYQEVLDDYQDVLKEFTGAHIEALVAAGRFDEIMPVIMGMTSHDRENEAWRLAVQYRVHGLREQSADLMTRLGTLRPRFDDLGVAFCHTMLPGILRALDGGPVDLHEAFRPALERRGVLWQALWYDASFLVGDIDEAAYLAQPRQRHMDTCLAFIKALRADVEGRRGDAAAGYEWLQAPGHRQGLFAVQRLLVGWRARQIATGVGP